jgi:hypothetical protein
MKKVLLIATLFVAAIAANAQPVCSPTAPNNNSKSYILPDSATGIKHGCAGLPYDETMYIKVFADTPIVFLGITVVAVTDSVVINMDPTTIGIPSYLTFVSVPPTQPATMAIPYPHLILRGVSKDSLACIRITGTVPAATPPGSTPLTIPFTIRAKANLGLGTLDTAISINNTNYKIVIDTPGTGACAVAIKQLQDVSNLSIAPNPTSGMAQLNCNVLAAFGGELNITNQVGQIVYTRKLNLASGQQYIPVNTETLAPGLYNVSISKNGFAQSVKLLVQ